MRMLELIEADQFGKLPGGVFAKSFVRQYARALGLDEEEIVAEFQKVIEQESSSDSIIALELQEKPPIRVARVPRWGGRLQSNSSFSALAGMVLVVVICSLAYNWWQRPRSEPAAAPPAPKTEAKAAPQPATRPAEPAPAQPADSSAQRAETPAPAPETAPPPVVASATAADGAVRIALTAAEATWISATSNGKSVFVGTLQPKETKEIAAADSIKLVIGNAGGIEITLNGKPIPPVGPKGQVRVVQLNPDGEVQVIPRKPPAPQPL